MNRPPPPPKKKTATHSYSIMCVLALSQFVHAISLSLSLSLSRSVAIPTAQLGLRDVISTLFFKIIGTSKGRNRIKNKNGTVSRNGICNGTSTSPLAAGGAICKSTLCIRDRLVMRQCTHYHNLGSAALGWFQWRPGVSEFVCFLACLFPYLYVCVCVCHSCDWRPHQKGRCEWASVEEPILSMASLIRDFGRLDPRDFHEIIGNTPIGPHLLPRGFNVP